MTSISNNDFKHDYFWEYQDISNKSGYISNIPPELIGNIISMSNLSDTEPFVIASKNINNAAIEDITKHNTSNLKEFIEDLIKKLCEKTNPDQIANLNKIKSELNLKPPGLSRLKQDMLLEKRKIIDVLKTLDEKTLENLEDIAIPSFLENTVEIAYIYRLIEKTNTVLVDRVEEEEFRALALDWARVEEIDRLIEGSNWIVQVINNAATEVTPSKVLRDIVEGLAHHREFDRAIKIANIIPDGAEKAYALAYIAIALANDQKFDWAIKIANSITNRFERQKAYALKHIATTLANNQKYRWAIEIADTIIHEDPHEDLKAEAFINIATAMVINREYVWANKILKVLAMKGKEADALANIAVTLAENHRYIEAFKFAKRIEEGFEKSAAYIKISCKVRDRVKTLTDDQQFDHAIKIANIIPDNRYSDIKSTALGYIAAALDNAGNTDLAIEIANSIPYDFEPWKLSNLAAIAQHTSTYKFHFYLLKAYVKKYRFPLAAIGLAGAVYGSVAATAVGALSTLMYAVPYLKRG